jgi:hypothetical protein
LRTHLGTSRLAGLLGEPAAGAPAPSGEDVAQRLGQWLGAFDAVGLRTALRAIGAPADAGRCRAAPADLQELERDLRQLREVVARSTGTQDDAPLDRRRHMELQRSMESRIEALRVRVRQALAKASPRLAQLAALDAAMEQAFGAREQKLLATLPALSERRLAAPGSGPEDRHRQVLMAELELRLAPVTGLIEALRNEIGPHA